MTRTIRTDRFDRTVRAVMWMDAFLSLALVAVCIVVLPLVALLDVPHGLRATIGALAIVNGVLLGGFGAVTGVALMLRMSDGDYLLPADLRLPLPRVMRAYTPDDGAGDGPGDDHERTTAAVAASAG